MKRPSIVAQYFSALSGLLLMAPDQIRKGCCQTEDSLAVCQVIIELQDQPLYLHRFGQLQKRTNEISPGVQHVPPVTMPK